MSNPVVSAVTIVAADCNAALVVVPVRRDYTKTTGAGAAKSEGNRSRLRRSSIPPPTAMAQPPPPSPTSSLRTRR